MFSVPLAVWPRRWLRERDIVFLCQEGLADQTNIFHLSSWTDVLFVTWSPVPLVGDPHILFPNKHEHTILHRLDSTDLPFCLYIQSKAS